MKNIIWSLSNNFLYNGLSALFIVILGNLLLPSDMGLYVTVIMIVSYAVTLLSLQVQSAVVQKLNNIKLIESRNLYFTAGWISIMLISLAVVSIMFLTRGSIVHIFKLEGNEGILLATLPLIFLRMNRDYFNKVLEADLKLKVQTTINLFATTMQIALSLFFVFKGYGVYGILLGLYIGDLLAITPMCYLSVKTHTLVLKRSIIKAAKDLISFGALIYIGTVAVCLDKTIDIFFVNYFLPKEQLAIYNYASMGALLLLLFGNSISTVTFPKLTRAFSTAAHKEVRHIYSLSMNFSFLILSTFALVLSFHAKYLIPLALPSIYNNMVLPMSILLTGLALFGSFASVGSIFTAKGIPAYAALSVWVSLGANIVLCLLLIPRYGLIGSAVATSISFIIRTVVGMGLIEYRIKTGYRYFGIFLSFVLFIFSMALGNFVLESLIFKEILIVCFALVSLMLLLGKREKEQINKVFVELTQ